MKPMRLNIRAIAFDGNTPLPSNGQISKNSKTGSHDMVGPGFAPLSKFGVLRMRDLVAHGIVAATAHVHVSWAAHSGHSGVTSFIVRSCHVGLGQRISSSPTRASNPSADNGQVGPFALAADDELVLITDATGEQLVTLELSIGDAVEVERLMDRTHADDEDWVALHASTHQNGGSDELNVAGLSGLLATPQTPASHATSHQNGGVDELDLTGMSGLLLTPQTPALHAASHQNGGGDELNVAGLSGELADPQPPKTHASSHQSGGGDAIKLDDLGTPDDNTDLDATAGHHGLLPKLSGLATDVLAGDGTWTANSAESLAATLAVGNVTGASDIVITDGQSVTGEFGGFIFFDGGGVDISGGPIRLFGDTYIDASSELYLAGADNGDAPAGSDEFVVGDGSAAFGMTIFTASTTSGGISFTDTAGTFQGQISYSHPVDSLLFSAAGSARVVVASTGLHPNSNDTYDVGLTAARWRDVFLARTAYVAGAASGDGHADADDLIVGNGSGSRGLTVYSQNTLLGTLYFCDAAGGSDGGLSYDHDKDLLAIRAGNAERVRLSSTTLYPVTDAVLDLGISGTNRFRNAFLGSTITPFVIGGDYGVGSGPGTALMVRGGEGGSTGGAGGSTTVKGGSAQSGNSFGGQLVLSGGTSSGTITGGAASLSGGTGGSSAGIGGAVTISGGLGGPGGGGTGGPVTIAGGAGGGGHADGGTVTITSGVPTSTGNPGDVQLVGSNAVSGNVVGGAITITAGTSTGNQTGGDVEIRGGGGGDTGGLGGSIELTGGDGGTSSGKGGTIQIAAGAGGVTNGAGGEVYLLAGSPSGTGTPGSAIISAAGAVSGNTVGGHVFINGGLGKGTSAGGTVTITSGGAANSAGNVNLTSGTSTAGILGVVRITNTCLEVAESSSVPGATITAGNGRYWVRNTTPSRATFTDDTNTSYDLCWPNSYSRCTGSSSRGTANTLIYIFTTETQASGSDISYTASGSDGSYWTINTTGIYTISASVITSQTSPLHDQAINVGSAIERSTNTFSGSYIRMVAKGVSNSNSSPMSWTGPITANQSVWISTSAAANPTNTTNYNHAMIVRVR